MHLWTNAPRKIGSQLIRWGLGEDCSHYALQFYCDRGDDALVIESRFPGGVRVRSRKRFLENNEVVHSMKIPFSKETEDKLFFTACQRLLGIKYDWPAIAYFAFAVLLHKASFRKMPLPKKNPWGHDNMTYCNEILWWLHDQFDGMDLSCRDGEMTTPHQTWELVKGNKDAICG